VIKGKPMSHGPITNYFQKQQHGYEMVEDRYLEEKTAYADLLKIGGVRNIRFSSHRKFSEAVQQLAAFHPG
jgi:hypothetical protein